MRYYVRSNVLHRFIISDESILGEYIELPIADVNVTFGDHDHGSYGLSYSHFDWCLKTDVESDGDYAQQFDDNLQLEFVGYNPSFDDSIYLGGRSVQIPGINTLKNTPLRLPYVSECFGGKSMLLHQSIFSLLNFSKKLGVNSGDAVIYDAFGHKHNQFKYVSFMNPLSKERWNKRLRHVSPADRPFVFLQVRRFTNKIYILKNLYQEWLKKQVSGVYKEYYAIDHNNDGRETWTMQDVDLSYRSLEDWQSDNHSVYIRD